MNLGPRTSLVGVCFLNTFCETLIEDESGTKDQPLKTTSFWNLSLHISTQMNHGPRTAHYNITFYLILRMVFRQGFYCTALHNCVTTHIPGNYPCTYLWLLVFISVCGGILTNSSHGTISSPGYPGNYPHNRDCVWVVSVPLGNNILISFATLALEHHANCSYDYLEVRWRTTDRRGRERGMEYGLRM